MKLLQEVDKEAMRNNRVIGCMLQFYIATEETKFGLGYTEARELLSSEEFRSLRHTQIIGVMGMATYTKNVALIEKEFRMLKNYFDVLSKEYFRENNGFSEISMGMSNDYQLAINQGSTMIRIGSAIFK
jgi:hypothetical protein